MFAVALFLLASTPVHGWHFAWDTHVSYDYLCWRSLIGKDCEDTIKNTGTDCTIYLKNGRSATRSINGAHDWTNVDMPSDVDSRHDTLMWTSCDDPMLVKHAILSRSQVVERYLGSVSSPDRRWWGEMTKGWCLGQIWRWGYFNQPSGRVTSSLPTVATNPVRGTFCYPTLNFKGFNTDLFSPKVYGAFESPHSGRRRQLEGIPTVADVKACEDDADRSQEECTELVDQILTYESEHPEDFVEITDNSPAWVEVETSEGTDGTGAMEAERRILQGFADEQPMAFADKHRRKM